MQAGETRQLVGGTRHIMGFCSSAFGFKLEKLQRSKGVSYEVQDIQQLLFFGERGVLARAAKTSLEIGNQFLRSANLFIGVDFLRSAVLNFGRGTARSKRLFSSLYIC